MSKSKKGLMDAPEVTQSKPSTIPSQQEMEDFLSIHLPPRKGQTMLVKHLWDNNFRLNYYKAIKEEHSSVVRQDIVLSQFVTVIVSGNGNMDVKIR